jgi:putative transposase
MGLVLRYLPRYSPHLNPMEGVWRRIKGFLMPRRFYPTVVELRAAVTQVLRLLEEPELKIQCTGT